MKHVCISIAIAFFAAVSAGAEPAAQAAQPAAFAGKEGYYFLQSELDQLAAGEFWGDAAAKASIASKPEWADPLPAILDFDAQLKALGIRLLLVPVPLKAAECAAMLPDGRSLPAAGDGADPARKAFLDLLREKGVEVVDLAGSFDAASYCRTDSHWTPKACEAAASAVAAAIGDAGWLAGLAAPDAFSASETELKISGDLAAMAGAADASETLPMRRIEGATEDKSSPVLLLGDSHCLVFHVGGDLFATGGGLADQLAFELKIPVDVLGVRGSGATPARQNLFMRSRADKDYIAAKKVVVWCFASREFTQSPQGWRPLPVTPKKQ